MLQAMIIVALNVTIKAIIIILQRCLSLYARAHLRPSLFATGTVNTLLSASQLPYLYHESYRTAFFCLLAFAHWPLRAGCGHLVWKGLQTRV